MLQKKALCTLISSCFILFAILNGITPIAAATIGYNYPDQADDAGHIYDYNDVKANDGNPAYTQYGLTWANLKTWEYDFELGSVYVDEVNFKIEAKYAGIGWCRFRGYVKYSNGSTSDIVTDGEYFTGDYELYYVSVNIEGIFEVDEASYYFYITQGALCTVYIDFVQIQIEY